MQPIMKKNNFMLVITTQSLNEINEYALGAAHFKR
jgi:hypothetical protein